MEFFMSLPFLKGHTVQMVKRILPGFTLQTYVRNQAVYSEKDDTEYVFIVQRGEFEVSKLKLKRFKQANEQKLKQMIGPERQTCNQVKDEGFQWSKKHIRISLYCSGQIFGHEDVIAGRCHRTTVKCLSQNGALYLIHKDEFVSKFCRDDRIWKMLTKLGQDFDQRIQRIGRQTHFISSQTQATDQPQPAIEPTASQVTNK